MSNRLSLQTKVAYGIGELGTAIPIGLAIFYLLFFLTEVVGLSATQAGAVLLIGRVWDAVNDPVIGWLSDRTRSRWGRRYPWLVLGALPLGFFTFMLWLVPPLQSQTSLFIYYTLMAIGGYAAFSVIILPMVAIATELTPDYDERTSIMSVRSAANIVGSVVGLVLAQIIFALVEDTQRQYMILGGVSGIFIVVAIFICVVGTYGQYRPVMRNQPEVSPHPMGRQLRKVFSNPAFRWVMGLYLCSWVGVQVTAAMLPFFVTDWMGLGEQHFTQMAIAVQGSSVLLLPFWLWVTKRTSKRWVYFAGAPLALCGLGVLGLLQPGQIVAMYIVGVVIGAGLSTFYLVPFAMLPDVIDDEELRTGERQEGIFISLMVFLQKVGIAIAIFISGWLLDWAGQISPEIRLSVIRLLASAGPSLLIFGGLYCVYRYPLTRCAHHRIRLQLEKQSRSPQRQP
ncbi:MFS transporter [Leptothoe kymatousa]|uniref:MFS transporter n=1 Tax=Leptothoe kymatousa TAU-MAC 1615 TaxID=2364775 RepID=A0ABS5Y0C6_9CYAN|nr:MFS transporter [Leptothoe kymatousa]MBT9311282.1 MFS transporter [Leptothoe kymatousa TAU-MAC 1615]